MGIAWNENEVVQKELEHVGGSTINSNLVGARRGNRKGEIGIA